VAGAAVEEVNGLVSIVLPSYNRRDLLLDAVASVEHQTYTRWELLIVDDGSTDGSVMGLPADERIRVIRLPHTGNVASVRNVALRAAAGTLVGFLDSDDRWRPQKLARQVARLLVRQDCGWCYGQHDLIDHGGDTISFRFSHPWQPREGAFIREMLTTEAGVALQTVIVRRDVAAAIRFDERIPFADDYDFLVRLAFVSRACVVDEVVADVREHARRTTHQRYDQILGMAMRYRTYRRLVTDRALKRVCTHRLASEIREYLSRARAAGQLGRGITSVIRAWIGPHGSA
jgi:glycosyltransferase involved in cell wall biosynthesis